MLESKLYGRVRPKLDQWGEVQRIENSINPGCPDVYYSAEGQANWIETKIIKLREGFNCLWFEKFQIPWMRRFFKTGFANIWVLGGYDDDRGTMIVYHCKEIINAPTHPYKKWVLVRLVDINAVFEMRKPYDWNILRTLLTTQYTINK